MALDHFGYMLQALDDILVHRTFLEVDAYIGTGTVAETLGVDIEAAASDDISIDEMLHTLMDGSTRDITLGSHILKRDSCIL